MEISGSTSLPVYAAASGNQAAMQPPAVAEDPAPASDAPSALKSFAYGIVGMATPDMQAEPQSEYYNTGRMVAAAATVGSLISLLA